MTGRSLSGRASAEALAALLRDSAASLEGLTFEGVSVSFGEVEREVLSDLALTRRFALRERENLLVGTKILFNLIDGRVNMVDNFGVKGIDFIKHGSTTALLKEYGLDEPYNACVLALITRVLAMGITTSVAIGERLPDEVLIFLQPPRNQAESANSSVNVVLEALQRFRGLSEAELSDFPARYRSLAERLAKCGIAKERLTADLILTTIQQEAVRACVRIDLWHRVLRSLNEAIQPAEALKHNDAVRADPSNLLLVENLVQALKRQMLVLQQHLRNLDRLKATVTNGNRLYLDCLLLIVYVHENRREVEQIYANRVAWTQCWSDQVRTGSIQSVQQVFDRHKGSLSRAIALPIPPSL
ncbi:MAG: hypothetical protein HYR63_11590 [Proteobacteria bacterium]|nr:hypothetical protein [Pseudomonadota bacterium]MBI3496360.1 hypothetical protein [Pseudomonadota bacterium]